MSARLDPSWRVVASPTTPGGDRCVDFFVRPDGSYGFEEFRRDPEDGGAWTPLSYYCALAYVSQEEALAAARERVYWLSDPLS